MRKGGHKLLGLAALASLMLIGGTWAAWTQEIQTGNEFMPGTYETSLDEKFNPPSDWSPGAEQEKRVWVSNKGTVPVMAKIVITQSWIRREDVYATRLNDSGEVVREPVAPFKGEAFPLTFQTEDGEEYASIPNFNKDAVVILDSGKAADSSLSLGLPVVSTVEAAKGKWLLMNEVPDEKGQYTLYYMGIVEPGKSTPELLEGVTLNSKLGRTITGKETRFMKQADGSVKKVTIDSVNSQYGYDSAKYTMDIKGSTVQATKAAVEQIFGTGSETLAYLAGSVAESGIFESATVKTLKFEESNGRMVYVPYRNEAGAEEGNWFMSFTDMVPGGIYKDKLSIENASGKKYRLYGQIVPREQDQIRDELLELIAMKVYYQGNLIYDGKATGASLVSEEGLLRVVPLGTYASGDKGTIEVELTLDPTLKLGDGRSEKVAGVLTKIDWKFMVTEIGSGGGGGDNPGPHPGPGPGTIVTVPDSPVPAGDLTVIEDSPVPLALLPKTGDTTPLVPLVVTVIGSGIILLFLAGRLRKKREE